MESSDDGDWSTMGWTPAAAAVPAEKLQTTLSQTPSAANDDWLADRKAAPDTTESQEPVVARDDRPLIIVDFTKLTNGDVHNRNDKFSNNDPDRKRAESRAIEKDYKRESLRLVREGIAHPSSASAWRAALVVLRDANPGHYFAPVFPPAIDA
jgi:hypothetical protein